MSEIFNKLCKGPVVIVDDEVNKPGTEIVKFLEEIQKHHLPVLKYETPRTARKELKGLVFSNFVIFDWMYKKTSEEDIYRGVQTGAAEKQTQQEENINFIKELQEVCLAPVFVISNIGKQEIEDVLKREGSLKEKNNFVFVQDKSELLNPVGKLVRQIEEWIKESPHVYLGKWWTNEWLIKNNSVFWDLYQSAPNWPSIVYKAFYEDGDEPILGLIEMLSQLIYSEIENSSIDPTLLEKEDLVPESLKQLYQRFLYTKIGSDIKPGDIFKKIENGGQCWYYLNIRPECDTTSRVQAKDDIDLYLLKGKTISPGDIKYDGTRVEVKENQIVLYLLDGNDIVVFNKRNLFKEKYKAIKKNYKSVCRVVHPYITKIRQSFANYMGRFGIPAYPRELLDEIFNKKACSDDHENK
jgi:hypothetical protein